MENINQNTDFKNDRCFQNFQRTSNDKIFNYNFIPSILESNENSRNEYINSTKTVGIIQSTNYDVSGSNINSSTEIRNGILQKNIPKKELDTRLFPGAPYLARGQFEMKNTDLASKLKFGEETRTSKSANAISGYSANNFIPLVPAIEENIQNVDHIIPTYWVRGGMSTRTVVRNIDYLKSCGLKK